MATPASRPSFDRLFFYASAVVLIAIIGINGWTLWRRSAATLPPVLAEAPAGPRLAAPARDEFIGPVRPEPTPAEIAARNRIVKRAPVAAPSRQPAAVASAPAIAAAPPVEAPPPPPPSEITERSAPPAPAPAPKPFYTAEDTDVIPPRPLSPQLIAMLSQESPGVRRDVLMIAVLVNEQGIVDSVRAVNLPVNIGESVMLTGALSAVKSWHFRPAVKNGAPVKYRQVVPLRVRGGLP